jgi:hypothetical protein
MSDVQPAPAHSRGVPIDLIVAMLLAAILSIGWSITDWPRLGHLLLPDPDDMMRLAQVRDWLAGQGINDWTQYRMAPPLGAPMHWSRINDFGIAAIILAATPLLGQAQAELVAVLLYPALLFAAAIFLSARIGRGLWGAGAGPIAAILTGLAYPGTTVFIPGRIDHHALQVVLIQLLVLWAMSAPNLRRGAAAGGITALSLVVGLETVPQVAVLLVSLFVVWVVRGERERTRLFGFAVALALVTLVFFLFLRPGFWSAAYCDAFTPASVTGALAGSVALGLLAAATPWLRHPWLRAGAGGLLGVVALGITVIAFPSCIQGPYGSMDPFLKIAFLPFIDEANSLFDQPRVARIFAIGGMLAVGCAASLWMVARAPRRWRMLVPVAGVVLVSGLIMLVQVRGAYIGAPLAAPVLAGVVLAARRIRRFHLAAVILAWLGCSGLAWLEIPKRMEGLFVSKTAAAVADKPTTQIECGAGDAWNQVDRYPPGVVMAGTSVAAYVVGATHHSTVGAGYHRNDAGNMAMYRFFLSAPSDARTVGRRWRTRYVLFCPGDFDEIQVARTFPGSLAAQLRSGRAPAWLEPVPLNGTPLRFYRIR